MHLISEVLQRYRYYGMTILIVFAAIGVIESIALLKRVALRGVALYRDKRALASTPHEDDKPAPRPVGGEGGDA